MDADKGAVPRERARVDAPAAARGGKPILLVSSEPFTGGDAGDWWREVAKVADIVLEKYFNAPAVHKAGPGARQPAHADVDARASRS